MTELEKYKGIYNHAAYAFYGHSNHGARAVGLVEGRLAACRAQTVLDVGCGWNEFVKNWRASHPDVPASGVDFACPGADIQAEASALPVADKFIGVLTSFDALEHLPESDVPKALREFARVSEAFVFSISYVDSRVRWQGKTLHPTVRSKEWWMAQIMAAGGCHMKENSGYISGQWGNAVWSLKPDTRLVLVGNGPSLLSRQAGAEIDAFDEVVRFNRYQLHGFESHTGKRTTCWSTFGHGFVPGDESERPKRMIFVYGERGEPAYPADEIYRIPKLFYHTQLERVRAASKRSPEFVARTGISSGCMVALWLLEVVRLNQVVLAGFDHFRKEVSSQHHYYNPKSYGRPPELDGDAEAAVLNTFTAAGKLTYL